MKLADTGETVTAELVAGILDEETERLRGEVRRGSFRALLPAGQEADRRHVPSR